MDYAKGVANVINVLTQHGHNSSATEYAALHALNVSGARRNRKSRMRAMENALVDLTDVGAVFDVSEAMRICMVAFNAIDNAAEAGVELSVNDAINEALEVINV